MISKVCEGFNSGAKEKLALTPVFLWLPLADAFRNKYYQEIVTIGRELRLLNQQFSLSL